MWKHSMQADALGLPMDEEIVMKSLWGEPAGWIAVIDRGECEVKLQVVMWACCTRMRHVPQGLYVEPSEEWTDHRLEVRPMTCEGGIVRIQGGVRLLEPPAAAQHRAFDDIMGLRTVRTARPEVREHAYVPLEQEPLTNRIEEELRGLERAAIREHGSCTKAGVTKRFMECLTSAFQRVRHYDKDGMPR